MLSLASPPRWDTTVPSPSTASTPRSWARVSPWRSIRSPPALVAMVPPTVAWSRLAMSTPYAHPAAAASPCTAARLAPAPAVTCPPTSSTGPTWSSPRRQSTTSPAQGHRPSDQPRVPALEGEADAHVPAEGDTAATCSVVPGRRTAVVAPRNRPDQSTQ